MGFRDRKESEREALVLEDLNPQAGPAPDWLSTLASKGGIWGPLDYRSQRLDPLLWLLIALEYLSPASRKMELPNTTIYSFPNPNW